MSITLATGWFLTVTTISAIYPHGKKTYGPYPEAAHCEIAAKQEWQGYWTFLGNKNIQMQTLCVADTPHHNRYQWLVTCGKDGDCVTIKTKNPF